MPLSIDEIQAQKTQKTKRRARQIAVSTLILGISFSLMALSFLPNQIESSKQPSFGSKGFGFFTSEQLVINETQLNVDVNQFDCENGKAHCTIIAYASLRNITGLDSVYFLLQIPFKIEDLNVGYKAKYPDFFQGENRSSVPQNESITYVYVRIPKGNVTFNCAPNPVNYLTFSFTIDSAFMQIDSYSYELPFTFDYSLHRSFGEITYLKNVGSNWYSLYFFDAKRVFLNVESANKYYYSQLLPSPTTIESSYHWDIKAISSNQGASTVIMEVMNLNTKTKADLRFSFAGLFLGIGIPMALTSFIELFKNKESLKIIQIIKESKKFIAVIIVISLVIFMLLQIALIWKIL